MSTVEETRRELFEAWVKTFNSMPAALFTDGSGKFMDDWIQCRWLGFNAALDAVVIELPAPISEYNTDSNGFVNPAAEEYDGCLDDCRAAIESTNLGITVK